MRGRCSARKKLFVCTKPYQYLICRLIKEGNNYDKCDLIMIAVLGQMVPIQHQLFGWIGGQMYFEEITNPTGAITQQELEAVVAAQRLDGRSQFDQEGFAYAGDVAISLPGLQACYPRLKAASFLRPHTTMPSKATNSSE